MSNPLDSNIFLNDFFVTRFEAGSYKKGVWNEGPRKEFKMRGSAQEYRNLELLQEQLGRRVQKALKIYSKKELFTSRKDGDSLIQADRVRIDGQVYEVHERAQTTRILPHFKTIVVLMDSEQVEDEEGGNDGQ